MIERVQHEKYPDSVDEILENSLISTRDKEILKKISSITYHEIRESDSYDGTACGGIWENDQMKNLKAFTSCILGWRRLKLFF